MPQTFKPFAMISPNLWNPACLATTTDVARGWWCVSWFLFVALSNLGSVYSDTAVTKPLNVLFVLADDLGVHDVGCYGTDLIETPHIDQFARQSLIFQQAYSPASVCTPTRASIMTGKHPARLKMTIWSEGALEPPQDRRFIPGRSLPYLPHSEITLAEKFRDAGYLTAMIGKWHLGDSVHSPETQGFDIAIGGNHWGAPTSFFFPYRGMRSNDEFRYVPGLGYGKQGEYLTDRLTDEALKAIDFAQTESRPFFVMLNHYAPHTPIDAKPEHERYFESKLNPDFNHKNPGYAAMIKSLDENVGKIIEHLERKDLLKNTIVVFTSDNGGYIGIDGQRNLPVTSNWPLRSGKASLYEGGLRVPCILFWPGKKGMGHSCTKPIQLTDLHATLLHALPMSNTTLQATSSIHDSVDLSPLLEDPFQSQLERSLFFHYPHFYHAPPTTPCSAVMQFPWKLIYFYEDDHSELYNLAQDPTEEHDLSASDVVRLATMKSQLQRWFEQVQAELPSRRLP